MSFALIVLSSCLSAVELRIKTTGSFSVIPANGLPTEFTDLAKAVPLIKANEPERIELCFASTYEVDGGEETPWTKLWYRRQLTNLSLGADGWDLKVVKMTAYNVTQK